MQWCVQEISLGGVKETVSKANRKMFAMPCPLFVVWTFNGAYNKFYLLREQVQH